jgi:hypothetical protein
VFQAWGDVEIRIIQAHNTESDARSVFYIFLKKSTRESHAKRTYVRLNFLIFFGNTCAAPPAIQHTRLAVAILFASGAVAFDRKEKKICTRKATLVRPRILALCPPPVVSLIAFRLAMESSRDTRQSHAKRFVAHLVTCSS